MPKHSDDEAKHMTEVAEEKKKYNQVQDEFSKEAAEDKKSVEYNNPVLLVPVLVWFFISGGLEGFFQSQTYSLGLCGPHHLPPGQAAILCTLYFSCFLAGRVSGVFLSAFFSPTTLIIISHGGCFFSSLLLVFLASEWLEALYLGIAVMGLCVSLQFASGILHTYLLSYGKVKHIKN